MAKASELVMDFGFEKNSKTRVEAKVKEPEVTMTFDKSKGEYGVFVVEIPAIKPRDGKTHKILGEVMFPTLGTIKGKDDKGESKYLKFVGKVMLKMSDNWRGKGKDAE